ncbi:hypothetical protein [Ornithinibacillus sp. 179-J 7C1 HS]|uniref:hypothetical protein n=1 Tax=Ornithinibacillus sp. 179-J 7C1 HS TaxID=3142384 RepID=UPI0039A2FEC4
MMKAKEQLKVNLDKEVESIQFTKHQEVLEQVYPTTWKQKLHKLWNKEISIPLIPVSTVFALMVIAIGYVEINTSEKINNPNQEKVIIQVAGNYYWKDEFERALLKNEN